MPNSHSVRSQITAEIEALEKKIGALKARLPAHSILPALVIELDELDEQLSDAKQRLAKINASLTD
jgi:chromosome segregation ATPase